MPEEIKEKKKKHAGGRPLLFKSVDELQKRIDSYFESCYRPFVNIKTGEIVKDSQGDEIKQQFRPFTISGLALALDTSRQTLINYQDRDEYFDTLMRAKRKCENFAEESLFSRDSANGAKFVLLNGYENWKDKQEIESTVTNKSIGLDFSKISMDDVAQLSNLLGRIPKTEPVLVKANK